MSAMTRDVGDPASFPRQRHRSAGVKDTATGKADNVVQKTQRSVETAVLVVDLGIDVAAIRGRDHTGNGLEVLLGPAAEFEARDMCDARIRMSPLPERQHHEQPGELLEAFQKK